LNTHLKETEKAFDKAAHDYDLHDNANPLLVWMREIVHKVYMEYLKPDSKILELNAGTGIDARYLASQGMRVYATDISREMIGVLKLNSADLIAKGMISTEVKSFDDIGEIKENNFDAVISNFGGLNCINSFGKLSRDISDKMKSRGLFIAVVMNKLCPWEIFYYMLRFKPAQAFRRLNKYGVFAELNGIKVKTYYFSPHGFAREFSKYFMLTKIYSLGLLTPPPYLQGIYGKFKPLVRQLMKADELICKTFPFNLAGDHFIIVMKKRN
jgi:SAM-dependent methyltransferase